VGIFSKKSIPEMTEIYPSQLLQKFDSTRTKADVFAMILYISEGIYAMDSNKNEPRFKSIGEFELSAIELLGSLDEETFPRFVQMLLFEPEYLNRFVDISASQISSVFAELGDLLELETPISVKTTQRFSPILEQIDLIVNEFVQVMSDLGEYVTTDSVVAISEMLLASRDFKPAYLHEMQRSMKHIEEFRNRG
jgi:hypothetical protein